MFVVETNKGCMVNMIFWGNYSKNLLSASYVRYRLSILQI